MSHRGLSGASVRASRNSAEGIAADPNIHRQLLTPTPASPYFTLSRNSPAAGPGIGPSCLFFVDFLSHEGDEGLSIGPGRTHHDLSRLSRAFGLSHVSR